ncbi:NAD-dependent epimerase/dehydratase family protein [Mitsuaria sp. GD03876]|uniref:NAD-dependent epimerase/dehydratase family protein n=1 Tax=Mitsuaria sp. GD03876 TaxID=2975399 RepID=UPI00244CDEB1|nr:NAD-dependent epimerase/dehydratase family protein [Mitsuaria sp. GD03876]MDH0864453.1 NAD-dependent epimerase/dehydratase family protein [Mitsuaria sp. GD03876]
MMERVLVTGGNGFVAGWCVVELLRRGYRVRATVRGAGREAAMRAAIASQAGEAAHDRERLEVAVADLLSDDGWDAAMTGCRYVLHVASPLGAKTPKDLDALLVPARDGTLRVLAAALRAGVERVVMTSAAAAARAERDGRVRIDETLWPDPAVRQDPYRASKVAAERAAWQFMGERGATSRLTTVLPGAVFGPVLSRDGWGSVQVIQRMLAGRPPAVPRLGFAVVDVRDLAVLHVAAMTSPAAAGQRFLATHEFLWMSDIATHLRQALGARAAKVPTRRMPDVVFRLLALAMPPLRMLAADLGRVHHPAADKARRLLGFAPRPGVETVVDCARSLLATEDPQWRGAPDAGARTAP